MNAAGKLSFGSLHPHSPFRDANTETADVAPGRTENNPGRWRPIGAASFFASKAGGLRSRTAEELAQALGFRGWSAVRSLPAVRLATGEDFSTTGKGIIRSQRQTKPGNADRAGKSLRRRMGARRGTRGVMSLGDRIHGFRVRQRDLSGMQIVGQRNRGKQKS